MSQRDVMGFQTISNVLFFDFEGNMSNVDAEISWKLSFIPLNSGGLYDISKPTSSLIYILHMQFICDSCIKWKTPTAWGGLERCPGNRERKWLFFVSCLNAMFLSIRCKNFHHSCKLWLLSFDFIKKNEQFSLFRLANLSSENKTRFFFGIRFLENCRKDCSHNLPN